MFISVKEAVELTGKSQTTIYRLCKKRIRTEYVNVENSQYFINKDFLLETYPPDSKEDDLINIEEDDTDNETKENNFSNINKDKANTENEADELVELADTITERIEKNATTYEEDLPLIEKNNFNFEKLSYWETIIGLSVSVLLIIGFILMLYFNSK